MPTKFVKGFKLTADNGLKNKPSAFWVQKMICRGFFSYPLKNKVSGWNIGKGCEERLLLLPKKIYKIGLRGWNAFLAINECDGLSSHWMKGNIESFLGVRFQYALFKLNSGIIKTIAVLITSCNYTFTHILK